MEEEQSNSHKSKTLIYIAVVALVMLIGYIIISAVRRPGIVSPLADDEGEGVRVIFVTPEPSEPPTEATGSAEAETVSPTVAPRSELKTSPTTTPEVSPKATPSVSPQTSPLE